MFRDLWLVCSRKRTELSRFANRAMFAVEEASVPYITIVTRRLYGVRCEEREIQWSRACDMPGRQLSQVPWSLKVG